jgi:hypothetical protein
LCAAETNGAARSEGEASRFGRKNSLEV